MVLSHCPNNVRIGRRQACCPRHGAGLARAVGRGRRALGLLREARGVQPDPRRVPFERRLATGRRVRVRTGLRLGQSTTGLAVVAAAVAPSADLGPRVS